MRSRLALSAAAAAVWLIPATAQNPVVPISVPDLYAKTGIAPAFFGPNAFQVPDMSDGSTSGNLTAELAGDWFSGRLVPGGKDFTYDVFARLDIPLFTDRVNLNMWVPAVEWFQTSPAVQQARRVSGQPTSGSTIGAAYLCLEVQVLKEKPRCPGIVLRAALRTASEGNGAFPNARSYDAAGYFFDFAIGKDFGPVRLALSSGFLCWQTDNGRQNDAVMFGLLGRYRHQHFSISAQYGGYWGWERFGDFPRVVKLRADGGLKWPVHPFAAFQYGFNDWPFLNVRLGIAADFQLIKKTSCKKL